MGKYSTVCWPWSLQQCTSSYVGVWMPIMNGDKYDYHFNFDVGISFYLVCAFLLLLYWRCDLVSCLYHSLSDMHLLIPSKSVILQHNGLFASYHLDAYDVKNEFIYKFRSLWSAPLDFTAAAHYHLLCFDGHVCSNMGGEYISRFPAAFAVQVPLHAHVCVSQCSVLCGSSLQVCCSWLCRRHAKRKSLICHWPLEELSNRNIFVSFCKFVSSCIHSSRFIKTNVNLLNQRDLSSEPIHLENIYDLAYCGTGCTIGNANNLHCSVSFCFSREQQEHLCAMLWGHQYQVHSKVMYNRIIVCLLCL